MATGTLLLRFVGRALQALIMWGTIYVQMRAMFHTGALEASHPSGTTARLDRIERGVDGIDSLLRNKPEDVQ